MSQNETSGWRYKLGLIMFLAPFPIFFFTPILIPMLGLSTTETAALVGVIIVLVEIVWFASIPLLGKVGFNQLKARMFGVLKLHDGPINYRRHLWGILFLFLAVILESTVVIAVLIGYFYLGTGHLTEGFLGFTLEQEATLFVYVELGCVVLLILAIYTLGSQFLEKLQVALSWQGTAT